MFSFFFCFSSHMLDVADKKRLFLWLKTFPMLQNLCKSGGHVFSYRSCSITISPPRGSRPAGLLRWRFTVRRFAWCWFDRLCINKKKRFGTARWPQGQPEETRTITTKKDKKNLWLQQIHLGSVMEQEGWLLKSPSGHNYKFQSVVLSQDFFVA